MKQAPPGPQTFLGSLLTPEWFVSPSTSPIVQKTSGWWTAARHQTFWLDPLPAFLNVIYALYALSVCVCTCVCAKTSPPSHVFTASGLVLSRAPGLARRPCDVMACSVPEWESHRASLLVSVPPPCAALYVLPQIKVIRVNGVDWLGGRWFLSLRVSQTNECFWSRCLHEGDPVLYCCVLFPLYVV